MEALKKWNKQFGERTSHTVEIAGVKYQFGGATSNQKNMGKPSDQKMWAFIGYTGHLAKLIKGEGNPDCAKISPDHMKELRRIVLTKILPHSAPAKTGREDVMINALKAYQYEFFKYCTHNSVLMIFLAVVAALTIEQLKRTYPGDYPRNNSLAWLREFQRDICRTFTVPIWGLPTESNLLPNEIQITSEQ